MRSAIKKPIGVYDSGVGGLTVLRELMSCLPCEDFIYFADTQHLPYGDKTPDQIKEYSKNIVAWFENVMNAKMVVAACNTSSAIALDGLTSKIPVIGTIYPILDEIMESRTIGIIATPASVNSKMHENIFIKNGFKGKVAYVSCPDFVPLIEYGKIESPETEEAAKGYLSQFEGHNIDTLIYGCTHYPFIKNTIEKLLPGVKYIDPANFIAHEVLKNNVVGAHMGSVKFYCSSDADGFKAKIEKLTNFKNFEVVLEKL